MSAQAKSIMNDFMFSCFARIAEQAAELTRINKSKTLTSREVQTAVRFILPGQLARHAVSEGTKAVIKYTSSDSGQSWAYNSCAAANRGGKKSRGMRSISRSAKAGLQFPVGRVHRYLKEGN